MAVSARRCEANGCATGALTTTLAHSASGSAVAGTAGSSNNWAASSGIAEALAGGVCAVRNAGATRPASAGPAKWWTANEKSGSGGGAGGAEQAASGSAMQIRRRNDMPEGSANVPRQGAAVRLAAFSSGKPGRRLAAAGTACRLCPMRITPLLAATALVAIWLLVAEEPAATAELDPAARELRSEPATPAAAAPSQAPEAVTRHEVGSDSTFVSESEERGILADAVRDGMVILVLGSDRQPRANAKLAVRWRKGFGLYGNDRGITDARGRFPTTVAEYEMLEGVVLTDPLLGELANRFDFLP